jgi:3-oxoacyl-[acyl-carrier protein] reductase
MKGHKGGKVPKRFNHDDYFLLMGSSSGMGKAIALELVSQGASIILAARSSEKLHEVSQACLERRLDISQNLTSCIIDHTDGESPARLSKELEEIFGPRSMGKRLRGVLVNGGGPHGDNVTDLSPAQIDKAYGLLFKGPVLHLQSCLPFLQSQSSIVAITSTTVAEPHPALTLSGAFRNALTSYLKSLSDALGQKQITVNSIAPGYVETKRLEDLLEAESTRLNTDPSSIKSIWASSAKQKRIGSVEEIAKLACFLFSGECHYLTGQVIVADGGQVRSIS